MRLVTFDDCHVGRVSGDEVVDLCPLLDHDNHRDWSEGLSPMRRLIARWESAGSSVAEFDGAKKPLSEVTLASPVPDPTKILAAPVNYSDHQTEMRVDSHVSSLGLFLKSPSSLAAPGGTVRLPYTDRRFDQEGELAVIIGRDAYQIQSDPLDAVFGYTGLLDITMRGGEDRSTRKSFATFTPMGPWIVTADEFGDPESVDVHCAVNGHPRQSANTRDLIWGVAKLVEYASWISPLRPGDVISTGTPAGVDALLDGDEIEMTVTGLGGSLTARVTDVGAVLSHTSGHHTGPQPPVSARVHR
jgi:2-keto-4-pentenoate hydratase/2-oxohepta-3-ene-1,7-dioic acid hydratase in catechol pathway